MAFKVRIFGYRGITEIARVLPKQYAADSVQMLQEPYEFSEAKDSNGGTEVSFTVNSAATQVTILRVEVADGQSIRYEVKPPGSVRAAGEASPRMSGVDLFPFAPGWTFSFVDAAAFP